MLLSGLQSSLGHIHSLFLSNSLPPAPNPHPHSHTIPREIQYSFLLASGQTHFVYTFKYQPFTSSTKILKIPLRAQAFPRQMLERQVGYF